MLLQSRLETTTIHFCKVTEVISSMTFTDILMYHAGYLLICWRSTMQDNFWCTTSLTNDHYPC
jgi:hypothetical protein